MPETILIEESKKTANITGHHVNKHEVVDFVAKEDCTVFFDFGFELKLKKDVPTSIAFSEEGTYPFSTDCRGQCDPTSPIIVPRT